MYRLGEPVAEQRILDDEQVVLFMMKVDSLAVAHFQ